MLVLSAPMLLLTILAIWLEDGGPVFFRQTRIGIRGQEFDFLKLRSMRSAAGDNAHREYVKKWIRLGDRAAVNGNGNGVAQNGEKVFKLTDDKRITRVGRIIRRYRIDELPQIINVLRGDMSLIGPRPALPYELELYKGWHRRRLDAVPGITGLWQVSGGNRLVLRRHGAARRQIHRRLVAHQRHQDSRAHRAGAASRRGPVSSRAQTATARALPPLDEVGSQARIHRSAAGAIRRCDSKLWQAFARSVRDNVFAEIALQVIRVGGMVVLARALMPNDFGIFRVLLIVMYFALIPIENGIPEALIQRRNLLPEHESTGWCLSVAVSLAMAMLIYVTAPLVAHLMLMPAIVPYIRLLCIPLVFQGTAMVSNARLRREMRFGALARARKFLREMVFLAAALLLLFEGYARWSLPGALAARIFAYSAALWVADRRFTAAWPRLWAARDFSRFTTTVWGARAMYTMSSNADFLLVGRFLGSNALGFYGMAWDLLRFVPDRLFRVAGRVIFPAFSRVQDDNEQMAARSPISPDTSRASCCRLWRWRRSRRRSLSASSTAQNGCPRRSASACFRSASP